MATAAKLIAASVSGHLVEAPSAKRQAATATVAPKKVVFISIRAVWVVVMVLPLFELLAECEKFAAMVLKVMCLAKPPDIERLAIVVVVRVGPLDAADFTGLTDQAPELQRAANLLMRG